MRIAYVCSDPGVPVFGAKGCSVHVQEVITALLAGGAEVELFSVRTGGAPPAALRDLPVHVLPLQEGAAAKKDPAERERVACAANGHLWAALEQSGPFDMVYERYSLWSFAGMEYAAEHKVPGLLEVNAPLIEEQAKHRGLVDRALAADISERVFGAASALLAVSREVADYLEHFPGARGRIFVVPNGVNPERFAGPGTHLMLPSLLASTGVFTVGFVGTLKPWHGLPTLVDAFTHLHRRDSTTRLLIVGDGPERERLEADLREGGVFDATILTGAVSPQAVPGLLASMDVAVAPYPGKEDFYFSPLKVYEYMAAGLPVVASRVGQLAEVIEDGTNGLLCTPGDNAALTVALARLRSDPHLCEELGRNARSTVVREHSWESVARRILALAREASPYATFIGGR